MAIIGRLLWMLARTVLWCLVVEIVIELVHRWLSHHEQKREEEGKEPIFESGVPSTPVLNILGNHPHPVPVPEEDDGLGAVEETFQSSEQEMKQEPASSSGCTSIILHESEEGTSTVPAV